MAREQKRSHLRFPGKVTGSIELIHKENGAAYGTFLCQVDNASFSGAKLTLSDLRQDALRALAEGQARCVLRVSNEPNALELAALPPRWSNTRSAGKVVIGLTWQADAPALSRMMLIERVYGTRPTASARPAQIAAAAGALVMICLWVLTRETAPKTAREVTPMRPTAGVANSPTQPQTQEPLVMRTRNIKREPIGEITGGVFTPESFKFRTDMNEGVLLTVRAAQLMGNTLRLQVAPLVVVPEGRTLFGAIAVSDALGNTVVDCTWRDLAFVGETPLTVTCELPSQSSPPLTVSGAQGLIPSVMDPGVYATRPQSLFDASHPAEPSRFAP